MGVSVDAADETANRNALLAALAPLADSTEVSRDTLDSELIDASASVALASVEELPEDRLTALAAAAGILASDQQFARLYQLAGELESLGEDLAPRRRFLSAVLISLSQHLRGRNAQAVASLTQAVGLGDRIADANPERRTLESLVDLQLAVAFRSWLLTRSTESLRSALGYVLRANSGVAFDVVTLCIAYAEGTNEGSTEKALEESGRWPISSDLSEYVQRRGIATLLPPQASAIEGGVLDPGSAVVAMPTSSGKTFLAELRIIAELSQSSPGSRALYLAPYRLLSRQVESEVGGGLRLIGRTVRDLGSGFDISAQQSAVTDELPDVAVMTPERLDALLRLSRSDREGSDYARDFLDSVALVVFDEVHLVGRAGRGPRLELLLTRWRAVYPNTPVLALSGVVDGVDGLAQWLDSSAIRGGRRPTGTIELLWRTDGSIVQKFDGSLGKVWSMDRGKTAVADAAALVLRFRDEFHPILVLETTRQNAERVARRVRDSSPRDSERWRRSLSDDARARLERVANEALVTFGPENDLGDLIRDGIAYHHAGLPGNLLRRIEDLASRRLLRVVAATTTVAEGAHLPFRVVVIPHLNFQGGGGRLDRSLYLNVLGRAGRAGVAMEGIVVVLDSDSRTLKGYVKRSLWGEQETVSLAGTLARTAPIPTTLDQIATHRALESQVLAWLGEPQGGGADQAARLASATFTGSDEAHRVATTALFDRILLTLEDRGLAQASSPYRLTAAGQRARLAGLGAASCVRLGRATEAWSSAFVDDLASAASLDAAATEAIASTVMESEEVVEAGLWLRRVVSRDADRASLIRSLRSGEMDWPYDEPLYMWDVAMLSLWMRGTAFEDIGRVAPVFERGIFSSSAPGTRAADAAELLGRMSYPAAWTWSAITAMLGEVGDRLPAWIRSAIELGLPSRVAVELSDRVGLTRAGAVFVASQLPSTWDEAQLELADLELEAFSTDRLAEVDRDRILGWR